jgi:hypothetical protein
MADAWLTDTRSSYDADASGYAEKVRGLLAGKPYLRASLTLFVDSHHRRPETMTLREAGFTIEAELMGPDEPVPGAVIFARKDAPLASAVSSRGRS